MTELTFSEDEEEYVLPSYGTKSNIIFKILSIDDNITENERHIYNRYEIEILAYDSGAGAFWLNEGIGIEYWINFEVDIPQDASEGSVWVIEGVYGEYSRGEWGFTDGNEYWYYDKIRPASAQEILDYPSEYPDV